MASESKIKIILHSKLLNSKEDIRLPFLLIDISFVRIKAMFSNTQTVLVMGQQVLLL